MIFEKFDEMIFAFKAAAVSNLVYIIQSVAKLILCDFQLVRGNVLLY